MTPRIRVHLSDRGSRRSLQLQRQFVDRWRYHVVRRYLRDAKMLQRLPWFAWCWACAWNGASVVSALGERSSHPLRFVQIGAHDGVTNDPLHATVVSHNWTGVAVEAVPAIYERLCANYAEIPGVACANVAIADTDGVVTIHVIDARDGDPAWVDQLSSLKRDAVLQNPTPIADLDERIRELTVEAMTLPSLVERHHIGAVDLLQVDVEGFDYEVVRQIDFGANWAPRNVLFETVFMSAREYHDIWRLFQRHGYRMINVWPDAFAWRSPPS